MAFRRYGWSAGSGRPPAVLEGPLVKDCQFGVSPVNYSDSDSDSCLAHSSLRELVPQDDGSWEEALLIGGV